MSEKKAMKLLGRVPPLVMPHLEEIVKEIMAFRLHPNRLYAVPFYILNPTIWDAVAIVNNKEVDYGKVRLGIFQNLNVENAYPGALIADFGEVDTSTVGEKVVEIAQALGQGLYWFVFVANAVVSIEGNVFEGSMSFAVEFPYAPLSETFPSGATEGKGDTPAFFTHKQEVV